MKKTSRTRELIVDYIVFVIAALLFALSYYIFVYPNDFAPSGLPGIATMIQYVFHINVGYFMMLINIPLTILVYRLINKDFAIKSLVFNVVFSAALVALEWLEPIWGLDALEYYTENGTSTILGPIAGGVLSGFGYGIVMRRNGSTGGTDFVAALIQYKRPEQNMLWILFSINAFVAGLSYFVYGFKLEPVILCLIYSYLTSQVSDMMLKGFKEAVKFEIITDNPKELASTLMAELRHGVTEIPAYGGFTHSEKTLLICVVGKRQVVQFQKILERFPGTFAYMTSVKETLGYFRRGN